MNKKKYGILLPLAVAALLCAAPHSEAQPKLPADSKVVTGSFPNGMNYYVVSNTEEKGFADFALVYRHSAGGGDYVDLSRRILSEPGKVKGRSLQKFLSSNGIAPSEDGYVSCGDDAVVFRFDDVMLSRKPSLTDSLMLAVFGIADELSKNAVTTKDSLHFPLENMAVVVSGDVDGKALAAKMGIFSLMTPSNAVSRDSLGFSGIVNDSSKHAEVAVDTLGTVCRICASFRFPRIPESLMPTAQFAVVDKMSETFRCIAENRLGAALYQSDIPFSSLSSTHVSSAETPGDESISLSFYTGKANAGDALLCCGKVLGDIDAGNISLDEIRLSSRSYSEKCLSASSSAVRNPEYVDLCISSFLYGAPLTTSAQLCGFCQSRVLPDTLQLRLMKNFSEALLSPDEDCAQFSKGWNSERLDSEFKLPYSDTLLLHRSSAKKSKVKIGKELMSDGELWTWQNGLKVYWKRLPGAKKISWGLSVDRGYSKADGLVPGEAAFLPELLGLSSISGISNADLRNLMTATGITAEAEVGLYSTTLKGTVLPSSFKLLCQGLVGMFGERSLDTAAVRHYAASIPVRRELSESGRNARLAGIDSLVCADNPYSGVKMFGNFTEGTVGRAEKLFGDIFSNFGDGFLVLVGDVDPAVVQKTLSWYVGEFPVSASALERRQRVRFQPVSGWSTTFRSGEKESIDLLLSTALPMNLSNLCASRLAACLLEDCLHDALVGTGFHVHVSNSFLMYPQERVSVMVSLDRIPENGFAYGSLDESDILSALERLRTAISGLQTMEWSDAVMNAYKTRLVNEYETSLKSPDYWRDALLTRYAEGRDFTSKMGDGLKGVSADQVRSVLKKLTESSRIEYVVMNK